MSKVTYRELRAEDSARIACQGFSNIERCDNPATVCHTVAWGNPGVSFFYYCPDCDKRHRARLNDDSEVATPAERLEQLRAALDAENISYGELVELQSLAPYIEPGDVQLLEAAGVPEHE